MTLSFLSLRETTSGRASPFLWVVVSTALLHLLLIALDPNCLIPSNILQTVAIALALGLSIHRFHSELAPAPRRAWGYLVVAFGLFVLAQSLYLKAAVQTGAAPSFPSPADVLWLLFPLPMLLLATTSATEDDPIMANWLDICQAALFTLLLFTLVFSRSRAISVTLAYDLQSTALLLACYMRYRNCPPGPVRTILRNVSIYLVVYAVCSSVGNRLATSHLSTRPWADLCWSYPPLIFCVAVLCTPRNDEQAAPDSPSDKRSPGSMPLHLQAASVIILTLLSGVTAAYVALSHRLLGITACFAALAIFVARTGIREAQLHKAHTDLEHAAHHDALTGLENRTSLTRHLRTLKQQPTRPDRRLALLFLGLDRFKAINDSLGHHFGDRLLVRVSELLRQQTREDDLIVRFGGDEFIILLRATTQDKAECLAERIVQCLHAPLFLEGRTIHITASVGVVLGAPSQTADELIRDADCAMNAAKKAGKDGIRTFSAGMHQTTTEALELEMDLRHAISRNELLVFYQPIFSASRRSVMGFEALSRWNHPCFGHIAPTRFIPVAEETGLILELGRQVLERATTQINLWNQELGLQLYASINVSARQFANPDFLNEVLGILGKTGLPLRLLKLEITESVFLDGQNTVTETLKRARHLGITISMDDFGTGYSSLSYLQRLPFDTIKIDRSFVHALCHNPVNTALVRTIIELTQQLGKEVVAEGVEVREEYERLVGMRCDLLQGFLFSKPVPATEAVLLLSQPAEYLFADAWSACDNSTNAMEGQDGLPLFAGA